MKRTTKRMVTLLLSLILVMQMLPMVSADTEVDYYGRSALAQLDNSVALLYAYDQIMAGVAVSAETISVYNGADPITKEEIQVVMDAYDRDHGADFWLGGGYSMSSNGTSVVSVKPTYIFSGAELETAKAAFDAKAGQILAGLRTGMSEYEKALYLHDELAAVVTYEDGGNAHNAYGALVEGKAVCQGYAEAYQHLLQQAGLQCFDAVGQSVNPGSGTYEGHEWSYVRIDGDYYHIDVTWDDQGEDLYHAYFGLTDTAIQEDHIIESADYALPVCDSLDAFYFMGKDSHLGCYDKYDLATLLRMNYGQVHVYISTDAGDADSFAEWYMANAADIAAELELTSYSYGYRELGREFILLLSDPNDTSCKHQNRTLVEGQDPGCVGTGWHTYQSCDDCGQLFDVNGYEIDEIPENNGQGHSYDANGVCTACGEHVSGTCGENLTWKLVDGVLTISGTGPMYDYESKVQTWAPYYTNITKVVIEEGVTTIGDYAFDCYENLASVQLPDSLTTIGSRAFHMTALTEVDLPGKLTTLECGAFLNCKQLTSVTIPATVTTIEPNVFRGSLSLPAIHVDSANAAYTDVNGVLYNKDKTTLICCPGGYTGTYTTEPTTVTVESEAFYWCEKLTGVTFTDGVKTIGDMAFTWCLNLEEVNFADSIEEIGTDAFWLCKSLTSVKLPASLKVLNTAVFSGCEKLETVELNEGLTTIYDTVFQGCAMKELTIPSTVTTIIASFCPETVETIKFLGDVPASIHDEAFYGVTATAYYPAGNDTWTDEVKQNYGGTLTWEAWGASGITVSGTVANFGDETIPVTVSLYQNGALVQSVTVTGSNAAYSFENVAPGTYTIMISKDGHRATEQTITVADEDVVQDGTLYLMGDVTGDGSVDNMDVIHLFRYLTGLDVDVIPENTDLNGDGSQDNMDVIHLFRYVTGLDVELH